MRESVQYTIRKRGAWSRVRPTHNIQLKDELATARKSSHSLFSWNCAHDTVRRSLSLSLSLTKPSMVVRKGSRPHIHALPAFLFEHLSTNTRFPPTHTKDQHTQMRNPCSHTPMALLSPQVCHRQGTWQSPKLAHAA